MRCNLATLETTPTRTHMQHTLEHGGITKEKGKVSPEKQLHRHVAENIQLEGRHLGGVPLQAKRTADVLRYPGIPGVCTVRIHVSEAGLNQARATSQLPEEAVQRPAPYTLRSPCSRYLGPVGIRGDHDYCGLPLPLQSHTCKSGWK